MIIRIEDGVSIPINVNFRAVKLKVGSVKTLEERRQEMALFGSGEKNL